jgi:hypothetical protein
MQTTRSLVMAFAVAALAFHAFPVSANAAYCIPAPQGTLTGGSCSLQCDGVSLFGVPGQRQVHAAGLGVKISLQFPPGYGDSLDISCSGDFACSAWGPEGLVSSFFIPPATCVAEGLLVFGDNEVPTLAPSDCSC